MTTHTQIFSGFPSVLSHCKFPPSTSRCVCNPHFQLTEVPFTQRAPFHVGTKLLPARRRVPPHIPLTVLTPSL